VQNNSEGRDDGGGKIKLNDRKRDINGERK
jgi:hypothetical protein